MYIYTCSLVPRPATFWLHESGHRVWDLQVMCTRPKSREVVER